MRKLEIRTENIENIPKGSVAIDCDPQELQAIINTHFRQSETIVYNGVAGIFESKYGRSCTRIMIESIKNEKIARSAISAIALGGEGVSAAIKVLGAKESMAVFDHCSTAGGAGLDFWTGKGILTCLESFPTKDGKPISSDYGNLLTIEDIKSGISGRIVAIIADLNLEEAEEDDVKIQALIEDIEYVQMHGASKIIIISHRGRPEGKEPKYSMRIYSDIYTNLFRLNGIIKNSEKVYFIEDSVGTRCKTEIDRLPFGSICVLENTRYHEDEQSKKEDVLRSHARKVLDATGIEVLIFCAAGAAHRKDATKKYLPELIEKKAIGFLMVKELAEVGKLKNGAAKPVLAIIQGAKNDKLEIVKSILEKNLVDKLIVLGKLAMYFHNGNETAAEIKKIAGTRLILPNRMTIARIPEGMDEKQFISWLKTQK